jgi:hypothetical protein
MARGGRVRRGWVLVLVVVAGLAAVLVAGLAALPWLVDVPRVQKLLVRQASRALGRPVTFDRLSVTVWPRPSVVLENLAVAEDPAFGSAPFVRLGRAEVRLRWRPLLALRVEFGAVLLHGPLISLVRAPDGRWNLATLGVSQDLRSPARGAGGGARSGPSGWLASPIRIRDGILTWESREAQGVRRYRLEGLDLTISPRPGALGVEGRARLRPGDLELAVTEGVVELDGARGLGEAPVRARLALRGRDLGPLVAALLGPEPALAGGVEGTLTLGGTLTRLRAEGDLDLSGVRLTHTAERCAEPRQRTLALGRLHLHVAWDPPLLSIDRATATLGDGRIAARLRATLDHGPGVEVRELHVTGVPVERVLVDFLCQGYALTGPLTLTGRASARLGPRFWQSLEGEGHLRVGPGQVVGPAALQVVETLARAGGAMSALLSGEAPIAAGGPVAYDTLAASYTISGGILATRDLTLTAGQPRVRVNAAGSYALVTGTVQADVRVAAGRRELVARITGPAQAPRVALAPGALLTPRERGRLGEGVQDLLRRLR